jgi:predicted CXXCH cytochrome family protein
MKHTLCVVFLSLLSPAVTSPVWAQKLTASPKAASVTWKAPNAKPEAFMGQEVCMACHPAEAEQFGKTIHASAAPASAKYGTGCESCHGPGKAHVDAMADAGTDAAKVAAGKKLIFSFQGKPDENAAHCLNCHTSSPDQRLFDRSQHKMLGVACNQCHSSHLLVAAAGKRAAPQIEYPQAKFFQLPERSEETRWLTSSLLKMKQPDLCFTCHKTIQAQFSLPSHHRVPEGSIKCTDCHEAHGTMNRPLLKQPNFEVCVSCHVEKRGPFLYEHPALKVEGCTSCHSPHGTVEPHLLTRREGRFLCLQCHVNPAADNVPHSRLSFQTRGECVRCHVQIHGSNVDPFFLQ